MQRLNRNIFILSIGYENPGFALERTAELVLCTGFVEKKDLLERHFEVTPPAHLSQVSPSHEQDFKGQPPFDFPFDVLFQDVSIRLF